MTKTPIKSVAAKVINDPNQDAESRSLAGYVLGDRDTARVTQPAVQTGRSLQDLKEMLRRLDGTEGQTKRCEAIRAEIARQEGEQ